MNPKDYVDDYGQIINAKHYRTAAKQALGSLIWIHQTRPDVGYNIAKMATDAVKSCTAGDLAMKLMSLYSKTVRYLRNHDRKIRYTHVITDGVTKDMLWGNLLKAKIISFTDAGFASLEGSRSIEGTFLVLGQVLARDGIIKCIGHLLGHRCAKIHRVCKSSLAAEAHAAVAACDQALWIQMPLIEIATGNYDIRRYCPPTDYPLQNPFSPAPTDDQVQADIKRQLPKNIAIADQKMCGFNVAPTTKSPLADIGKNTHGYNDGRPNRILFEPILLIDSRSLFTAILRIQPRSDDKCAKITPKHLRDLQTLLRISYIDAPANLADTETKHAGSLDILARFMTTGQFDVSFVGRRKMNEVKKSFRDHKNDKVKWVKKQNAVYDFNDTETTKWQVFVEHH